MTGAIVCKVESIVKHPNADRLEICSVTWRDARFGPLKQEVVTGCHYDKGQRGVYIPAGAVLPGYIAEDTWLRGRASANAWVKLERKNIRGIESGGMFVGEFYRKDSRDSRSVERANSQLDSVDSDRIPWAYWRSHWKLGDDVSAYLGIRF